MTAHAWLQYVGEAYSKFLIQGDDAQFDDEEDAFRHTVGASSPSSPLSPASTVLSVETKLIEANSFDVVQRAPVKLNDSASTSSAPSGTNSSNSGKSSPLDQFVPFLSPLLSSLLR